MGAGGISQVSAKSQSVGTWEREVPECDHVGAEASNCEYLDAGVSAKSHSIVSGEDPVQGPAEDEAELLAKQSAKFVAKQQVNSK